MGGVEEGTNTITDSWAAGYVTAAGGETGGLVGNVDGGSVTVTNSYWDKLTTGQTTSASSPSGNGLTTTALQGSLQTGLDDGAFGIVAGVTYPYLTWQVPSGTLQVLAGTVYAPNGTAPAAGQSVSALVAGAPTTPLVAMDSGADGYYYLLFPSDTIGRNIRGARGLPTEGSSVFAYLTSGLPGNSYAGYMAGGDGALNIDQDRLTVRTEAANTADLLTDLDNAVGSASGADFLYTASGGFAPNTSFYIADQTATFTINTALDLGTGSLWLYDPAGAVTESGNGSITARVLRSTTESGLTLDGDNGNAIDILDRVSNSGSGGISLLDDNGITVAGAVNAGTDDLSLTTIGAGNIAITGSLTAGGTVTLSSASAIWESNTASIAANTLTGSSANATHLQGVNTIDNLGDFTTTGANFVLTDNQSLTVTGTVNVGSNGINLETTSGDLVVGGALDANVVSLTSSLGEVSGAGTITAGLLDVAADTGIDLTGSNEITHVGRVRTNSGTIFINR